MKIKLPKEKDKSEWRRWFAWYPVYVRKYGERFIVWLETIETSTLYGAMASYDQYRFKDNFNSKAFCECKHELLQDVNSVKYYREEHLVTIVCSRCDFETTWDLDAPVPLLVKQPYVHINV